MAILAIFRELQYRLSIYISSIYTLTMAIWQFFGAKKIKFRDLSVYLFRKYS